MNTAVKTHGFRYRKYAVPAFAFIIWIVLWMESPACAICLEEDLCLIRYDEKLQPHRQEDQRLLHVLARESEFKNLLFYRGTAHSRPDLNRVLKRLTKKLRFALSPGSVIKPFILVQKIETILWVYQSKTLRNTIQLDEQFQAKTMPLPNRVTKRLQAIKKAGTRELSMTPYQGRIYGLHFQFVW